MNKIPGNKIITGFLAISLSSLSLNAASVVTDPVGAVKTTLPAGANLYSASFVNGAAHNGTFEGLSVALDQTTLTASGLNSNAYDAGETFPTHYIEITEDTDLMDGLDTEGLMFDVVSNNESSLLVNVDLSSFGVNGDENFIVRPHMTLGLLFGEATGFTAFFDNVSLYNPDGSIDIFFYTNSNWVSSDFMSNVDDAVVYPGEGLIVSNQNPVTIVSSGHVKLGATQIPLYASTVNILGLVHPVQIDLENSGVEDVAAPFFDTVSVYNQTGSLNPDIYFYDSSQQLLDAFLSPISGTINVESDNPIVASSSVDRYVKIPAVTVAQ